MTKRVVAIADLHCGHRAGLTPPEWQANPNNPEDAKWAEQQKEMWNWYYATIKRLRPIHWLLVCGDCVDGKAKLSESRDSLTTRRKRQVNMALTAIDLCKAEKIEMTYGTRYHVNDWEEDICSSLGDKAHIGAHGLVGVNGVLFDLKHKVGRSDSPQGRYTAIAKEELWNLVWSEDKQWPRADWLLRAHVHYSVMARKVVGQRAIWGVVLPCLQDWGSEYGAEQCSGTINNGLFVWDISSKGGVAWHDERAVLECQKGQIRTE